MNGFYFIDKPIGISSFDIIRCLRKKLNIRKIWHTWTLDPLASWGMILALWNYTKLIPYLERDKKTYEFSVSLDWITDSFDLWEEVKFLDKKFQNKYKKQLTKEYINDVLNKHFSWKINQIPPKYSALKIDWKRAYELARIWKNIEMKSREVEVFNIEILEFNYPQLFLKAEVSAWTYIRSIASDLWDILGTGWYITKLRRTKISGLDISLSQCLDSFDWVNVLDVKMLFSNNVFISLYGIVLSKINNGMRVMGNFDYPVWIDLFVFDWAYITNVVRFDGECLFAIKKI